jgi:hypothetical protein
VAAITWINWYFFAPRRSAVAADSGGGFQRATPEVNNGYDPAVVRGTIVDDA